jgi:hypothetical protein
MEGRMVERNYRGADRLDYSDPADEPRPSVDWVRLLTWAAVGIVTAAGWVLIIFLIAWSWRVLA